MRWGTWASVAFAAMCGALLPSPASAQWQHVSEDDPFTKTTIHIVVAEHDHGMIGFRCDSSKAITALLVTTERLSRDEMRTLVRVPMKLLVAIDNADVISFAAMPSLTPDGVFLRFEADNAAIAAVVLTAAAARVRIGMAAEINGTLAYRVTVPTANLRSQLQKLINGCRLEPARKN